MLLEVICQSFPLKIGRCLNHLLLRDKALISAVYRLTLYYKHSLACFEIEKNMPLTMLMVSQKSTILIKKIALRNYSNNLSVIREKSKSQTHVTRKESIQNFKHTNISYLLLHKHQAQPPEVFFKISYSYNFAIFTGKHLCCKIFLIKLQASMQAFNVIGKRLHRFVLNTHRFVLQKKTHPTKMTMEPSFNTSIK